MTDQRSMTETARQEAGGVAQTAKEDASQVASTAGEQVSRVASEATEQARNLLREGRGQLTEQAREGQQKAATGLRALSDQLQQMADKSDGQGMAPEVVRQAADRTRTVASWLEDREPGDLVGEVRRFARRKPGMFLAGAAIAGVLVGRLTRGAIEAERSDSGSGSSDTGSGAGYAGTNGGAHRLQDGRSPSPGPRETTTPSFSEPGLGTPPVAPTPGYGAVPPAPPSPGYPSPAPGYSTPPAPGYSTPPNPPSWEQR